jgi:APA family basic amino acid/polyamine antiporter
MPGYGWLAKLVTVAILAGFSSVILVMLLGQSRVFYSMSRDGLVPGVFSEVHPKYRTPYKSNWIFFVVTGLFAAFVPESIVGDMTSIGTLFAFILVCAGIWILRVRDPGRERGFKTPMVPLVPILGIVVCGAMIYGLGPETWYRLVGWLIVGLVIYFGYGRHHSRLQREAARDATIRAPWIRLRKQQGERARSPSRTSTRRSAAACRRCAASRSTSRAARSSDCSAATARARRR